MTKLTANKKVKSPNKKAEYSENKKYYNSEEDDDNLEEEEDYNSNEDLVEIDGQVAYNNGFIFLGIPHDFLLPPKILYISLKEKGSYDETIKEISEIIIDDISNINFNPIFKSTDGEKGISSEHNWFYRTFIKGQNNFHLICENSWIYVNEQKSNVLPIGDPLHLFKNFRARLINDKHIATFFSDNIALASFDEIQSVLNLGNVTDDKTQIGKMRDVLAVQLCTFNNVVKLLEHGCYASACAFARCPLGGM